MSKTVKSLETESRLVARGMGTGVVIRAVATGYRVSFRGDRGVLKLVVIVV